MNREVWISAVLALLIFAVFGRVAQHEFINYDDPDYITENQVVKEGLTKEGLAWAFGSLHGERTYWHPLSWISHMLDVELFGLSSAAHHLMNVFFHAVNAVLLFLLFLRMTDTVWRSAMVAALFALHPLQVDTVAWVTERKNLLSTMFWILTTMAYVRYARCLARPAASPHQEGSTGRSPHRGSYVLMIVLFALGLMCKPALVTLPFVLLLLDYWPLKRWAATAAGPTSVRGRQDGGERANQRLALRLVWEKAPLFVLSAVSSWITTAAHAGIGMVEGTSSFSLWLRLENALVSYARYLGKIIWPSDLAILYPHPGAWPKPSVLLSALVLLAITAGVLASLKRKQYRATGWFWFLGVLVPMIGIVQVGPQAMADRFAYVPIVGIFVMFVWGAAEFALFKTPAWLRSVAAATIIAACASASFFQLRHWKNSETVFTQAIKVTEKNYIAHLILGADFAVQGKRPAARKHALAALRVNPKGHEPFRILGLVCESESDFAGAISNYHRGLSIKPDWPSTRKALAGALAAHGDLKRAEAEYLKLTQATPRDAEVFGSLALLYLKQQKPEAALRSYRTALDLSPKASEVLNNLAWFLATYPDANYRNGADAVQYAERACDLTGQRIPVMLGTLAAAYAEAGRFDDAVRTAQQAGDLARKAGDLRIAETNTKLLELYRAKKPYREAQQPL